MTLRIVIAPSGFKESLAADDVADCIEAGVRRVLPEATIRKAPLADGGEGFAKALVAATGGTLHEVTVTGPVGEPVEAHFGILGGDGPRTGVLEMAAAAGLRLVPKDRRDPLLTTTYGVGELIDATLDAGAARLLVGCGDSGTNDGGAGMAQALGVRLLRADGSPVGRGGAGLSDLDRIDPSGRDPRLDGVTIDVACNPHNLLCGPHGVARVFGPQKGASPEVVARLEASLDRYATIIERDLGHDVREIPGGGASGGLGAGLHALLGATLCPRFDIVMQYLEIDSLLEDADLVFTAEGAIDFQTPRGKIPAEVARRAKEHGLPVIALVGTVGREAAINYDYGIDAFASVLHAPSTLEEAMREAADLTAECAEMVTRIVLLGQRLGRRGTAGGDAPRPGGTP